MELEPMKKMTKARTGLVLDNPFFGSLALRFQMKEDGSCQTAWTDGYTLGFNPDFIAGLSLDVCKAVIAHEVMHVALDHATRRGGRDHKKWNVACDFAVNPLLRDSGFSLPDDVLLDPNYAGQTADWIYNTLPDDNGGDSGGDPGGMGEVRDLPSQEGPGPATETEQHQFEQEVQVAMSQARQLAKSMGSVPGCIDRLVEEALNPKLNWREILFRFIELAAKNNYQWFPPNRRFVHAGIYLPSIRSEELGTVVIAVDTSGSISEDDLSQFSSEISAILGSFDTEIHVVYCDTKVNKVEHFSTMDLPLELHPQGGGGTDFRPVFKWVDQEGITPSCMVFLTDLFCDRFPDDHPAYPVLWIAESEPYGPPPFGETITF